jgi:hypothetical protein
MKRESLSVLGWRGGGGPCWPGSRPPPRR